jgi:uncharacterized membrane protein
MKKTSPMETFIIILIIILPLVYAGSIYASLPETIPIHFNLSGKADGYGSKATLWIITTILSIVSAAVYLLLMNLPKIDPKKTASQSPELYHKIAVVLVVFLCAINILLVYSSLNRSVSINNLMLPLLGLLFLVLGNYMHSVKPNYFIGLRVPWTLENEDNWRKTHQLMGKLWVAGGLLITICTLFLPAKAAFFLFIGITAVITIIPAVFSYRYFKKHPQS